jgi:hypothetical protein
MITSEKLIEMIKASDPTGKRVVYVQRDPEGNGYEPASSVWCGAVNTHGDVGIDSLTEEARRIGFREEDVIKGKKVLVVAP